jgi:rSAM/selenodomain-associated transferase 2
MAISIIVPVLNEAVNLRAVLTQLHASSPGAEIIVVDGGSADGGAEIARELAGSILVSAPGRAVQMNAGAKAARGDTLWFVHADSTVSASLPVAIERALLDRNIVGGCFRLRLESPKLIYRVRDAIGNFLVEVTGIALGDRGFFCRRNAFFAIGGYPEIPILEDAEFYRKLKQLGRVVQLPQKIGSSVRRYEALGPLPTMLFYAFIMLLYVARVPLHILQRLVRSYIKRRSR